MKKHSIVLCLALALPLAACGMFTSKQTKALRRTPEYKAGYQDGCNSAAPPGADKSRDQDLVRDAEAYRTNAAYRSGWNRGLGACRAATGYGGAANPGMSPNAGPIPDRNPGNGGLPGAP